MVLPYTDMNPPWVYTCSPSWSPRPPPSPYRPSEIYLFSIRTTDWENLDNLTPLMEIRSEKSLFGIDDSFQITYTHITYFVCVCVCVCVLTWLKISWIWSLYREILVISPLQSHYLNRWRSFKFWKELCYLFSYKFVPADISLKFWFSSFSHISSWKTWFPWVYLLSTGERPGVDQAGKKVTNIWFQNCDQPEQIAEERWDVQSWSTIGPSG